MAGLAEIFGEGCHECYKNLFVYYRVAETRKRKHSRNPRLEVGRITTPDEASFNYEAEALSSFCSDFTWICFGFALRERLIAHAFNYEDNMSNI